MSRRALALAAIMVAFAVLTLTSVARFGLNYEESVVYAPCRTDIVTVVDARRDPVVARHADHRHRDPPEPPTSARLVRSDDLPRLALEAPGVWLPLFNQIYMTNHLALAGALLARVVDPVLGPRILHGLVGMLGLLLLYDVGRAWLTARGRLFAAALAAASTTYTFMFTWARFDESLPSIASLATLAMALRYHRDRRFRWLALASLCAGLGLSAKLTTLWPLGAMALAAVSARGLARPSPRTTRHLVLALPIALVWLVPFVVNGLLQPDNPVGHETLRRLALVSRLVTTAALPRAIANLVLYLGSWGGVLRGLVLGTDHPYRDPATVLASASGTALVLATLAFLVARALRPGPSPRRSRPEASLLIFLATLVLLVALFYNEHQDYQFVLAVPLFWLGPGALLDALASRARALGATALLLGAPLAGGVVEHTRVLSALERARTPMLDLHVQRTSAVFLRARGITRPIDTTFHATAVYEQLSRCGVRPLHVFPLFRDRRLSFEGLARVWAHVLALDAHAVRHVLLPLGDNPVESRHFDEPAIRRAFLAQTAREGGHVELVRTFTNRAGDPLLELYRVGPRVQRSGDPRLALEPPEPRSGPGATAAAEVAASARTLALLAGLRPGKPAGPFTIASISEPTDDGAIRVLATRAPQRVVYELRPLRPTPSPPARSGPFAIYYRAPTDPDAPTSSEVMEGAQGIAALLAPLSPSSPLPDGLRPFTGR